MQLSPASKKNATGSHKEPEPDALGAKQVQVLVPLLPSNVKFSQLFDLEEGNAIVDARKK